MGDDLPQEFGQYTLHDMIGRGGMAEIYRATMPGIGGFEKTVAIKKILPHLAEDEEFTTMLIDEARIIESLDHSNIAQVFDLGKREGTYYIAMEYIHGVDLSEVIDELERRAEPFPIPHILHITSSICAGLHSAHSKTDEEGHPLNVIHRDISPHNIRLSFAGEVKIIDFGVAKAANREAHTKMGVIKGKLLYMAPEQAKAEQLDGRADLFATGLCAYKMLTGTLPFEGENEFQIYNNVLQKEIVPPGDLRPDVPEKLNRIVMKLLRRDPAQRYQEGYDAKQDLDQLLHEIAPGYTVNRLSRWVEENFSHLVQTEAEGASTETSAVSSTAPPTPSRPNPGTGEREPSALEPGQLPDPDGRPVRENVSKGNPESETMNATPDAISEPDSGATEEATSGRRETETSDGETGTYGRETTSPDNVPPVLYAIGGLVVAIAGMIGWALVTGDGTENQPQTNAAESAPADRADEDREPSPEEMVSVSLTSEPTGAKLVREGQPIGETPTVFELPKRDEAIKVKLSEPGYRPRTIRLVPDRDLDRTIRLRALDAGTSGDGASGSEPAADEQTSAPEEGRGATGASEGESRGAEGERSEESGQTDGPPRDDRDELSLDNLGETSSSESESSAEQTKGSEGDESDNSSGDDSGDDDEILDPF